MNKPTITTTLKAMIYFLVGTIVFVTLPLTLLVWSAWFLVRCLTFCGEAFVHRNEPLVISDEYVKSFMLYHGIGREN